jgi:TRAP-type C4-dicarboxylate transport system permease small subunit
MRLGFLWERFGLRGRAALDLLAVLIGLFIFAIITWQAWLWAVDSWVVKESTMGAWVVPLLPGRIGLAIGSSILTIQYVIDLIRCISQLLINSQVGAEG